MSHRRIAIAGFQHETNTFAPSYAGIAEFRKADSWPGLLRGQEVVDGTRGMNLPIVGAVVAAEQIDDIELVPLLWCAAEPSGPVTDEAFDWVTGMILAGLSQAESMATLDAIYLDLHGAMVTDSYDDGEAELLRRIRQNFGPKRPIGVSLDLHANISPRFVEYADVITIYRTYPHLDMAKTGHRCMARLLQNLDGCQRHVAFRQAPFLVPLHAQNTGAEPCQTLYKLLDTLPSGPEEYGELAMGFTAADIPDCGPSLVTYANSARRAEQLADQIFNHICSSEAIFNTRLLSATEAVTQALSIQGTGPVLLADVQDNAGAGGSTDTTGLLRALITCEATSALLGVMADADIAHKAHKAGCDSVITGALGGKSGVKGDAPFEGKFKVRALSEGIIPYKGDMYGGSICEMGPSCLLSVEDITGEVCIVVSSERTQCLDRSLFTHFGVEPNDFQIVCVKSTVHFRADFEPGSRAVLNVVSPGWFPCELENIPYHNLRPGIRLGPLGATF